MANKYIRRTIITILAVMGILIALQVFAIVMINPNAYKGIVQERLASLTGRDVNIGGDFNYSLSLIPTVTAHALTVKDPGGREFITVSDFSMSPRILSLLSGKPEINDITLSGVRVVIDSHKDIQFQPDIPKKDLADEENSKEGVTINRITLRDAMLAYYDQEYKISQIVVEELVYPIEKSQAITIKIKDIGTRHSNLEGDLTLKPLKDGLYSFAGLLESSRFDLADLMAAVKNNPAQNNRDSSKDKGLWLRKINTDIDIKFHDVVYGQSNLGELGMNVHADQGKLNINILENSFADGTLSGQFTLENNPDMIEAPLAMALDLDMGSLNYGRLSKEISGITILRGETDIKINLASVASDMSALIDNAEGNIEVIAEDGRIDTGLIDMWASNLVTQMIPGLSHQTTNLNCAVARFQVENGKAHDKGILIDTGRVTVSGKAVIDIAQKTIDMVLKPKAKDPSINFSTAVRVYGDLYDPKVGPDVRDLATKIGGLALGAINPLALVVPLVDLGASEENPCVAALNNTANVNSTKQGPVDKAVGKAKQILDKLF